MKTGRIISRGVQLYKKNWRQVLILGFLVAIAGTMSNELMKLGGEFEGQLFSLLFDFLLCPLLLFGVCRYYLGLWRGQSANLKGALHYCHSGESYCRVLWFDFCYACIVILFVLLLMIPVLIVMMLTVFTAPMQSAWSIGVTLVIFFAFVIWLSLRVYLSYYLYLFDEHLSAWQALKGSFDLMKGNVVKLLPLYIFQSVIALPYEIPVLALRKQWLMLDGSALLCCQLLIFVGKVIISPLVTLTSAGFVSEILSDQRLEEEFITEEVMLIEEK